MGKYFINEKVDFFLRSLGHRELLLPIAIVAAIGGCITPTLVDRSYRKLYNEAHTFAISVYGDKQPPMMVSERDEWYKAMGVQPEHKPTRRQLQKFIDDCVRTN
jgi:hypothetical protein